MKTYFIFFIFVFHSMFSLAQGEDKIKSEMPLNSYYVNILGDASLISINYERILLKNSKGLIAAKVGLGYGREFEICLFGNCSSEQSFLTIPHHITKSFGSRNKFFEVGLGATMMISNEYNKYLIYPIVGYRLHPLKNLGLNFRIYVQFPLTDIDQIFFIPIGVSLGTSF
ncbi:MAG: hypothetical protein IPM42_06830 [Saprospiraceae bacterium]|nr:hypothetical protein [Saprospiraceae bacterium]